MKRANILHATIVHDAEVCEELNNPPKQGYFAASVSRMTWRELQRLPAQPGLSLLG